MRAERVRARLVGSTALGYSGLVAVVTWQAGRGQSLIHPDTATLAVFAAVVLVTAFTTARTILAAKRATTRTAADPRPRQPATL
jgi:hypothetical protein